MKAHLFTALTYGGFFLMNFTHMFFTLGVNGMMTVYFLIMFACHVRQVLELNLWESQQ
jgi:hypothetical protein